MTVFDLHRLKNGCLDAGRATKPPENARQSKPQLAFHGRFSIIVGSHRCFEGLVILYILERRNVGLGRETVAQGVAARTLFAFWRGWSGAFERVAAIGFNLL